MKQLHAGNVDGLKIIRQLQLQKSIPECIVLLVVLVQDFKARGVTARAAFESLGYTVVCTVTVKVHHSRT